MEELTGLSLDFLEDYQFLPPLRGCLLAAQITHGLCRRLYSFAASRLGRYARL